MPKRTRAIWNWEDEDEDEDEDEVMDSARDGGD
jgi:hypothetical protein